MTMTGQEGRRQQLAGASDPRVARTRERIIASCRDLLDSGRPVTVAAICTRAKVGRSTFYTHFATVGDVAVAAVDRLFDGLITDDIERRTASTLRRPVIVRVGLHHLLRAVLEERAFFLYALAAPATERVRERFVSDLAASMRTMIRMERPDASEAFHRTAAAFTANGAVGALLDWVADPAGRSEEEMIDILSELLPPWLMEEPRPATRRSS
jgi:AcrR family transcriptional regulator